MTKLEQLLTQALELLRSEASPTRIQAQAPDLKTALIGALVIFFRESKIKKGDFAERYNCKINYISRLLNGDRDIDVLKLANVLHSYGFGLRIEITTVEIVKI